MAAMRTYVKNENWNIVYENGLLVVTAGADHIFAIEDVTEQTGDEITGLWKSNTIRPNKLSDSAKAIFEQLLAAGVFIPKITKQTTRHIRIEWIGDRNDEILSELKTILMTKNILIDGDKSSFLIFIRTNGRLKDIVGNDYASVTSPHLLADLAYDHTVSVGPLVIPGDTACLGCLVGRLSTYWGDAEPPKDPAITQNARLAASLIALEVEKAVNDDLSLISKTVAYDFNNRQAKESAVYKLPWCPAASKEKRVAGTGYIELPWGQQRKK